MSQLLLLKVTAFTFDVRQIKSAKPALFKVKVKKESLWRTRYQTKLRYITREMVNVQQWAKVRSPQGDDDDACTQYVYQLPIPLTLPLVSHSRQSHLLMFTLKQGRRSIERRKVSVDGPQLPSTFQDCFVRYETLYISPCDALPSQGNALSSQDYALPSRTVMLLLNDALPTYDTMPSQSVLPSHTALP